LKQLKFSSVNIQPNIQFKFRVNFFVLLLLIISCKTDSKQADTDQDLTVQGMWEQEGYGNVYEIGADKIISYNTTSIGCALADELPLEAIESKYELKKDSLFLNDGINKYRFKKITKGNHLCSDLDENQSNNPLYNFDFLWETFNDNYCYFQERNINWQSLKDKYRSRLNDESSDLELYKVLLDMTNEIGDGHVGISADDETEDAYEEQVDMDDENDDGPGTIELLGLAKEIALSNADDVVSYNKGIVNYGSISDNILYLQVNSMMVMADYNLSDTLDLVPFVQTYFGLMEENVNHNEKEMAGINNLMQSILAEQQYDACILDIRFNGGGKDEVALEIMSFLSDKPYSIGEKKALYKGKWTRPIAINQHANSKNINGPLVVLTSHETASAAEIMTMSALAHPNATLVGSRTEGIFSDMLDKVLPNEWDFSLSNEVYLDYDGVNHEARGIKPDIILDYDREEGYGFYDKLQSELSDKDEAILKAIELIKSNAK